MSGEVARRGAATFILLGTGPRVYAQAAARAQRRADVPWAPWDRGPTPIMRGATGTKVLMTRGPRLRCGVSW